MQPLVLAIEPDLRQAAIVKRIVREKVLADVTVVDSRDAALEAMRTMVPDVLLVSALLSPRDEDELVAHLRTLEHAEHLQTHTIPQLASANLHEGEKPSKGLLAAFRRRKGTGSAPAGCDPELFADEVRTYLQRASEKKREMRDAAVNPVVSAGAPAKAPQPPAAHTSETTSATNASSWDSPFEWRPTREAKAFVSPGPESVVPRPASVAVAGPESVVVPGPESVVVTRPESVVVPGSESVVVTRPESVLTPVPVVVRAKLPLVKRHAREWWFEEKDAAPRRKDTDSELRDVLASLSVPLHVAAFAYPEGCRIRRVRLNAD